MKLIASWLRLAIGVLALAFGAAAFAQSAAPGKDYRVINPPQPTDSGKRVEVLEFFWYGCPHCNSLQQPLPYENKPIRFPESALACASSRPARLRYSEPV